MQRSNRLLSQINELNQITREINIGLNNTSPVFSTDLSRQHGKNSKTKQTPRDQYNYNLLRDGLHPGINLSKVWLKKLELQINQRLPWACNRSPGSKLLSITTQLHYGGHLGGRLPDTILEEDHPMTIPSKFGFNWATGSRQDGFLCEFPIGPYVKLSTAVQPSWSEGGTTRHNFGRGHHPMTILSKFGSNWATGSRQEDLYVNFP